MFWTYLNICPLFRALVHHNFNIEVLKHLFVIDLLSAQGKRTFAWHNDCPSLAARQKGLSWETNVWEKLQMKMSLFYQRKLVMDSFKGDFKH